MGQNHRLSIDLGTCHTIAVIRRGVGAPRSLLFDGTPLLPSGVYAAADGNLLVGRDAERMSHLEPARFEPSPKRRVDDNAVLLGDTELSVVRLLSAILGRVVAEARHSGVEPQGSTVLTCPADWGQRRRSVLLEAARAAGLGNVDLVDEPVAAASYCQSVLHQQIPPGGTLVVFDLGGGTLDVTVIRMESGGLRVLAVGGLDDLGGVDFDEVLVGHLYHVIEMRDPEMCQRLRNPERTSDQRDRRTLWNEVRIAKEMLSRMSAAPVSIPGSEDAVHLTRQELERIVAPLVDRAVDETRRVLRQAGFSEDTRFGGLTGILLVGGASRMPLVATRLHARLGVAPTVPEQPELPVAYGALTFDQRVMVATPQPVSSPPTSSPPVSSPPTSSPPVLFSPTSSPPVSSPPVSSVPSSHVAENPYVPPVMNYSPQRSVRRSRPRTWLIVGGVILSMIALMCAGATYGGWKIFDIFSKEIKNSSNLDNLAGSKGVLDDKVLSKPIKTITVPQGSASAMAMSPDTLYYAIAGVDTTEIIASSVKDDKERWRKKISVASPDMSITIVGELVILDVLRVASHKGKTVRSVFDIKDGSQRWSNDWPDCVDISYIGTDALVQCQESTDTNLSRIDLRTGKAQWKRPNISDMYMHDDRISRPVVVWPAGASTTGVPAAEGKFQASIGPAIAVDPTVAVELSEDNKKVEVVNAADGKRKVSASIGFNADTWVVFNNLVIGKRSDSSNRLTAYRLGDLTQAWDFPLSMGSEFKWVAPCAEKLVCALVNPVNGENTVISIGIDDGLKKWEKKFSFSDVRWFPTPQGLVLGQSFFESMHNVEVLDPDKGESRRQFIGKNKMDIQTWAISGSRIVVSEPHVNLEKAEVTWLLGAVDIESGGSLGQGNIGPDYPEGVAVSSTAFAVLTKNNTILIFATSDKAK